MQGSRKNELNNLGETPLISTKVSIAFASLAQIRLGPDGSECMPYSLLQTR